MIIKKNDKSSMLKDIHEYLKVNKQRFTNTRDAIDCFMRECNDFHGYADTSIPRLFYGYEKSWKWYAAKGRVPNEPPVDLGFVKTYFGIHAQRNDVKKEKKEEPKTIEQLVKHELAEYKTKVDKKDIKKKFESLLAQYKDLEESYETLVALKEYAPEDLEITPTVGKGDSEAIAIIQYSDWHIDEFVKPSTVNYRNEYNPDVARKRAVKCFQNTLRIVKSLRHDIVIKNSIIQLGGDFIGGYIHPELEQTNSMSPLEGIRFASELLINGIKFMQEHGGFEGITIVCNRGNHGRTTKKMQSNDYAMNLEQNMYYDLATRFANDERIKFVIEDGELIYVKAFDKLNRFFHGHQVKSMGGIGGIGIPLYKQLLRWDASQQADFNFMCDKHSFSTPVSNCNINGSLKGWDAYAVNKGFKFEEPLQSLQILDNKRGYTSKFKIICE